ncbi:hypothetical protein [Massilia varians]|uniref:hypothetical protein n=1 Tax=Massilia varians TaxID=457921 RepID=UPI0025554E81|nr:hypothetical protein [Massilia varians]MDK6078949.1 hypothetical protein [Massilia varians]
MELFYLRENMNLSDDKHTARLSIDGELTADDLQRLISDLAAMRAKMLPEVPNAPRPEDTETAERVEGFAVRMLSDEYVQLLLRDLGLGWLSMALDIEQACALRDFLNRTLPQDHPVHFLDEKVRDGDLPQ